MNQMKTNTVFRREYAPIEMLFVAAGGLMIVFCAIYGMSNGFTTWRLPVWEMPFIGGLVITVFLLIWFGFAFGMIWYALRCIHTVHITPEEISIRLGPIVLHRMSLSEVRTVIRIREPPATYGTSPLIIGWDKWHSANRSASPRLVISRIPAEQLLERATGSKRKEGVPLGLRTDPYYSGRAIKKYVQKNWMLNRFWIGHTNCAEEALRKHLTAAKFVL